MVSGSWHPDSLPDLHSEKPLPKPPGHHSSRPPIPTLSHSPQVTSTIRNPNNGDLTLFWASGRVNGFCLPKPRPGLWSKSDCRLQSLEAQPRSQSPRSTLPSPEGWALDPLTSEITWASLLPSTPPHPQTLSESPRSPCSAEKEAVRDSPGSSRPAQTPRWGWMHRCALPGLNKELPCSPRELWSEKRLCLSGPFYSIECLSGVSKSHPLAFLTKDRGSQMGVAVSYQQHFSTGFLIP